MKNLKLEYIVVLILAMAVCSFGQGYEKYTADQTRSGDKSEPSRYFLGSEENVLLPVNIFGMIEKPGQYMVPYRTDLITLLAYAGGFKEEAEISEIKIIRSASMNGNGYNGKNGRRTKASVYKINMERYFEKGDLSQILILMPDDTILVTGSTAHSVNKFFDYVSKGVMLAQIYFFIKVAQD